MSDSKSFTRRLVGFLKISIKLNNTTGLLIQMPIAAQAYRIGGADRYPMVTKKRYRIRDSETELEVPYIPGSSLKGRLRSLLELALGRKLYTTDGKIWSHVRSLSAMPLKEFIDDVLSRDVIDELFGWAAANYKQIHESIKQSIQGVDPEQYAKQVFSLLSPTRLLVSDLFPTQEYIIDHNVNSISDFLEEKPENRVDRVTSAADPRDVVRVRPGVVFGGTITLLLFEHDESKVEEYINTILLGLRLVEETYLGGYGSRGYGRVKFVGESATVFKINVSVAPRLLEKIQEVPFSSLEEFESRRAEVANAMRSLYR